MQKWIQNDGNYHENVFVQVKIFSIKNLQFQSFVNNEKKKKKFCQEMIEFLALSFFICPDKK